MKTKQRGCPYSLAQKNFSRVGLLRGGVEGGSKTTIIITRQTAPPDELLLHARCCTRHFTDSHLMLTALR